MKLEIRTSVGLNPCSTFLLPHLSPSQSSMSERCHYRCRRALERSKTLYPKPAAVTSDSLCHCFCTVLFFGPSTPEPAVHIRVLTGFKSWLVNTRGLRSLKKGCGCTPNVESENKQSHDVCVAKA